MQAPSLLWQYQVQSGNPAVLRSVPHEGYEVHLLKIFPRISNATDQMMIQILHSTKHVYQPDIIIICHRIDRKISSAKIFFQTIGKADFLRMTAILICTVNSISRHLTTVFANHYCNCSVFYSCINRPAKYFLDCFWFCRRCDIPVLRFLAKIESLTQPPTANASYPASCRLLMINNTFFGNSIFIAYFPSLY